MDSIIASVHPKWWGKIKTREKRIEVRKSVPLRIGRMPFRIIWYVTGLGVAGDSVCNGFINAEPDYSQLLDGSCLTPEQLMAYGKGDMLHGWVLEETTDYEKPILLSEIGIKRPPQSWQYFSHRQKGRIYDNNKNQKMEPRI